MYQNNNKNGVLTEAIQSRRIPADETIIKQVRISSKDETSKDTIKDGITIIQETAWESNYKYSDGTLLDVAASGKYIKVTVKKSGAGKTFTANDVGDKFSLLNGKYRRSFDKADGVVKLLEQDRSTTSTTSTTSSTNTKNMVRKTPAKIVGKKRKVCGEETVRTVNIMDYMFEAYVSKFYSVSMIYGPTQSGKTRTTFQKCIDTMNKEDCPTIFITRNYTDEAEQQFKTARAKARSHGFNAVFLRDDNDYKELARCMTEGVKSVFIGLGNETTVTKIAKYVSLAYKRAKYIMALDEADIYVNKKEESQTSVLLKGLLDGALRKLFISATLLDVTTLITETDHVDKVPTKFAFGDFGDDGDGNGDEEYYRSFDSFDKYFIDTKDPVQCLTDVMKASTGPSIVYHEHGLPYITAMFHSEVNSVNRKNALEMSNMNFKLGKKTVKMSMITCDQTGTKLYLNGKMHREFGNIQEALTYVRVSKHKYVNILCGKMFSRAFNVTCTEHLCYISTLMYLMGDTDASLMVQRIGRMCGISKLKNKCTQYLYAPKKTINKCIDTVKINQCMIAQTDRSVPFLESIPKMVMPKRTTHGNVKLSMTRIEKRLKIDTEAAEAMLERLAPIKLAPKNKSVPVSIDWEIPEVFEGEKPMNYMIRCFVDYIKLHKNTPGFFEKEYTRKELMTLFDQDSRGFFTYSSYPACHRQIRDLTEKHLVPLRKKENDKYEFEV